MDIFEESVNSLEWLHFWKIGQPSIGDKFLHNTFYKCASYACPGLEALLLLFEELCSDWSDLKIIRLAEKQSTH